MQALQDVSRLTVTTERSLAEVVSWFVINSVVGHHRCHA